ncbi:DNA polymerase beta superfamily protein [Leifsonia sp. Leaf264]|uniref:DNA polymerase beta superfamily protein n=1 Tax=Leifsonia sp. Leaf264 TaxID=1736314 RepID=UPI0006F3CB82|nr:nucleotidyltransferase domain-containing protein [Leifsonia sp. Leaf264]KQO98838.1 hypothetical protein ASF30_12305 [Leifsonia sp. Leaf264]
MPSEQRLSLEELDALPILLRTIDGSEVHGTALSDGNSDIDHLGIAVEAINDVLGTGMSPAQWTYRTAVERAQKEALLRARTPEALAHEESELRRKAPRSLAGDFDIKIYPARKWASLAVNGNPSVLTPLFVDESYLLFENEFGAELRENRHRFMSVELVKAHFHYMQRQKENVSATKKNRRISRPELIDAHGFDSKFAAHYIRLGHQGLGVLNDGTLHIPLPEDVAESIRAIRRGDRSLDDVLAEGAELEAKIESGMASTSLPQCGDQAWADSWLTRVQLRTWGFA